MGEEKKKKKKKKEEKKEEEPPPPPPEPVKKKSSGKKKSKKRMSTGPKYSGPLAIFTEKQLSEFKLGFNYMDQDKDGVITKTDLFRCYDLIGKNANDQELDEMIGEAPNPITFTQMLTLFAERMQGGVDDDELIVQSFKAFDDGDGTIEPDVFRGLMMGKGDRLTTKECDDIFPQLPACECEPHPRNISLKGVIGMLCSKGDEAELSPPPPPPAAKPAAAEPAAEEPAAEAEAEEESPW